MSIDLTNLAPAPWRWEADGACLLLGTAAPHDLGVDLEHTVLAALRCESCRKTGNLCLWPDKAHADFILLARMAFDVMVRRGWTPMRLPSGGWIVREVDGSQHSPGSAAWPDPFTALCLCDCMGGV